MLLRLAQVLEQLDLALEHLSKGDANNARFGLMLRPAKGQFQMFYRSGYDLLEYQPDFVAETEDRILMLEPKMATQMQDVDVLAKRDVAVQWCGWATDHAQTYGGKPWQYALIPHDTIAENMTLDFLLKQFG